MKITFEWTGTNGEPLPEEQLSERIQEVRNLDAQQLSEGALVLPGVKDGPPLRLSDNLSAIAVSFCIEAPKQLIAGRPVTISFFASDASLTLKPDGKNVELFRRGLSYGTLPESGVPARPVRFVCGAFLSQLLPAAARRRKRLAADMRTIGGAGGCQPQSARICRVAGTPRAGTARKKAGSESQIASAQAVKITVGTVSAIPSGFESGVSAARSGMAVEPGTCHWFGPSSLREVVRAGAGVNDTENRPFIIPSAPAPRLSARSSCWRLSFAFR